MNQNLLTLKEFSFFLDTKKPLFEEQTLVVNRGEKIGLVGVNGSGKSTLMHIINGDLEIDEGEYICSKAITTSLMSQEQDEDFFAKKLTKAVELFEEPTNKRLFGEFGISNLKSKHFSGGQRRKISLIVSILDQSDILLLDEPTNHLDLKSLEALEKIINSTTKTMMIISHDRYFLDRVCSQIVEIENGQLFKHQGNYSSYLENKKNRVNSYLEANRKREEFLKREVEWVNSGVKARETKNKGRLNRYYEVLGQQEYKIHRDPVIRLPKIKPFGNKILKTEEVGLAYDIPIIKDFNIEFEPGMKVGIVGDNGVGKSTLVRLLMGEIKKDSGVIRWGANTEFNYINQMRAIDRQDRSVFDYITEGRQDVIFGERKINAYGYLKSYLFDSKMLQKRVGSLSGGQRARLMLAGELKKGGNFLVLDEPTNDLDMQMINILEKALVEFDGCELIISHDRFFLDRICTHILFLKGEGKYILSSGGWTDFENKYHHKVEVLNVSPNRVVKTHKNDPYRKFLQEKKSQKDSQNKAVEKNILRYEEEKTKLETILSEPNLFNKDKEKFTKSISRLKVIEEELLKLYSIWN